MPLFRTLALIVLSASLSACQLYKTHGDLSAPSQRMQGTIIHSQGQWMFNPCNSTATYTLKASAALSQELIPMIAAMPSGVFADFSGLIDSAQQSFTPSKRYRLQMEGHACNDPDLARLQLRASGNEPFWSILQTPRGLIFNQIDQASIALPYIEEQLGEDHFRISSQANNQTLELWITPGQCIDSMSGAIYHLQATLKWNEQRLNGCAAFGALRN